MLLWVLFCVAAADTLTTGWWYLQDNQTGGVKLYIQTYDSMILDGWYVKPFPLMRVRLASAVFFENKHPIVVKVFQTRSNKLST